MQLRHPTFALAVLGLIACSRPPDGSSAAASASAPPPALSAAVSPAPSPSGSAHEHASHHDHEHDHEHGHDDDSPHARLHRGPDPNAPPLEIPLGHTKVTAKPPASVPASPDDPLAGKFTLAQATKGLAAKGKLIAELRTDLGTLSCELYADRAPITVANFVGLARGLRPFKDAKGAWVKRPAYDGASFDRIERSLLLHVGELPGAGDGSPGYVIPDETWENAYHQGRGLLCMANGGANQNGMRFFLLNGAAAHLDGGNTIFGKCGPETLVDELSLLDVDGDRPRKPPRIRKVTIRRVAERLAKPVR